MKVEGFEWRWNPKFKLAASWPAASWWLVSVVDNDHVKGNRFEVFGL